MAEQTVTLTVTLPEANGVFSALANLPYGQVVTLIDKIKRQVDDQMGQAPVPAPVATPQPEATPSIVTPATQV
jgi:hypothetical protein